MSVPNLIIRLVHLHGALRLRIAKIDILYEIKRDLSPDRLQASVSVIRDIFKNFKEV